MTTDKGEYGDYYWCIKVTNDVAADGEIYIMADTCRVSPTGALLCLGNKNRKMEEELIVNLAIAPGKWNAFYAASIINGSPVAVVHWEGEVLQSD